MTVADVKFGDKATKVQLTFGTQLQRSGRVKTFQSL